MLKLVKRKNTPYWIARGTINGHRIERSTGYTGKAEARACIPAIIAECTAEQPLKDWSDMGFAAAANAYMLNARDIRFLDRLIEHFKDKPLGEIDNAAMTRASNALYPRAAPATIRRQLYVPVKAIINFVKDDRLRAPKGEGRRTAFFTPEQAEDLIRQLTTQRNPYMAALVTFWIGQGPRTSETINLCGKDVNLSARYAVLKETKNGEERTITLIPRVVAALSVLPTIREPGPVFRRFDGTPFQERKGRGGYVRNPFRYAVEKIGLDPEEFTPHVCRHTWATWFYAVTKDPLRLKSEGGWLSNEYQRYVKAAPAGLADSVREHNWDFMGENWGSKETGIEKSTT